jgi:copper(I)-binding protein
MKPLLLALRFFSLLSTLALADHAGAGQAGDIMIHDGWARASIGKAPNSAAYMTVMTHGGAADRLVGIATPAAAKAELHNHVMEDGIARMRPIQAIEISPGEPAVLAPGGLHIMLMGLSGKLEAGTNLPLTLTFEQAGEVTLEVPIRSLKDAMQHQGGHEPAGSHNHGS